MQNVTRAENIQFKYLKYLSLIRTTVTRSSGLVHTKQPSLLLSIHKKTRAFEKGCIVAKKGAIRPIFEGDMLPQQRTPKVGRNIKVIT
jgi:hypothetical protein